MRWIYALILLLVLLLPLTAWSEPNPYTTQGTLQNAAKANSNGAVLNSTIGGYGFQIVTFIVSGTFSATINPEGTQDGQNWQALFCMPISGGSGATTFTTSGAWKCNLSGAFIQVRARISGYASGTITITGMSSFVGTVGNSTFPTGPPTTGPTPYYDVTWYGADTSGTNDSTTAILNTINALPSSGGIITGGMVYFPPGTYLISNPLSLTNAKGVIFQGSSKTASTVQVSTTAMNGQSIFAWDDVRDSSIRDLNIVGISNGAGGSAPDACIESKNGTGSTVTPTNDEFRNLILNACVKGIKFTQTGGDANNDNHHLFDVFATTMSGPALSIEHSQSQGHTLVKLSTLATCGVVKTVGGNYKLIGGELNASVGCIDFEFASGTYQLHTSSIIDVLIEDGAKTLSAAASSSINVFISHLDKLQNPATNIGTDIAWDSVGGRLTITDSFMDLGFPATLSATDSGSSVTLTNNVDSFGTISWSGALKMAGNTHLTTVTYTQSGTGKLFAPDEAIAFASLGTPGNGSMVYCNDCTIANPCASGGNGAMAKRLNGIWVCN